MHQCFTTKNGTEISPQMFKIMQPSSERGNIGVNAFVCVIQSSICIDALFRCMSTIYFKTKRMDRCIKKYTCTGVT